MVRVLLPPEPVQITNRLKQPTDMAQAIGIRHTINRDARGKVQGGKGERERGEGVERKSGVVASHR
jgi:hypothetical protein